MQVLRFLGENWPRRRLLLQPSYKQALTGRDRQRTFLLLLPQNDEGHTRFFESTENHQELLGTKAAREESQSQLRRQSKPDDPLFCSS